MVLSSLGQGEEESKDKMEWPAPEFLTMYCALSGRSGKAGVGGETEVYFKE